MEQIKNDKNRIDTIVWFLTFEDSPNVLRLQARGCSTDDEVVSSSVDAFEEVTSICKTKVDGANETVNRSYISRKSDGVNKDVVKMTSFLWDLISFFRGNEEHAAVSRSSTES